VASTTATTATSEGDEADFRHHPSMDTTGILGAGERRHDIGVGKVIDRVIPGPATPVAPPLRHYTLNAEPGVYQITGSEIRASLNATGSLNATLDPITGKGTGTVRWPSEPTVTG
jgi:hypothetical protein